MTLEFVVGDTAPAINGTIRVSETEAAVDLSGCEVRFQMRKADDRRFTVNAAATITDGPGGLVVYSWAANDLSVPGTYLVQWEVTYNDDRVQTTSTETIRVRRQ